MTEQMTLERVNKIFEEVQELREFVKTGGIRYSAAGRQNGKYLRVLKFVENIEMISMALDNEEHCFNCAHLNNKRVCNDCILGYHKNLFEPLRTECEACALFGTVGKELIRHTDRHGTQSILCQKCHLREHRKECGACFK